MSASAIMLSARYDVPSALRSALEQGAHVYGHAQPSPDEIGGVLDFTDWRDEIAGIERFIGRWTLLYFGYSRCTGSCTTAIPLIVEAAAGLRGIGLPAQAAFVDIDSAPLGLTRIEPGTPPSERHAPHWDKRYAMRALMRRHHPRLLVLTGNRGQLAQAGIAYHVIREHIPPRPRETGHSINHSSMIYFIAPDLAVAGYGYHDADVATLVATIAALDSAPVNPGKRGVRNRQNAKLGCAPTAGQGVAVIG